MNVDKAKEFIVVTPIKGLSTVGAYLGNRVDGYKTIFFPLGTVVNNVRKFPYELKKFWADVDGVEHVFWKENLKPRPKAKKVKADA
jgi:hypothetical protein